MKKKIQNIGLGTAIFLGIISISTTVLAAEPSLQTDIQKQSYAIGQQIGHNFKTQGLDVDLDVLKMSINDVLTGNKSQLTPQESQDALTQVQKNIAEKKNEQSMANKKTSDEFLAANKKKKGVITTDSGLQYMVVREGTGAQPKATDTVKVHYKGTLIDGKIFDSSYKRNAPVEFPLNRVIKGWTEGIPLMKVGGKSTFYIPSNLAYGPNGRPGIPGNSALIFEVELLDIVNKDK